MKDVTFITGNQGKADFLAKHVDGHIKHQKVELDEIQSLSLKEVTAHKAKQAFAMVKSPVLVEDVEFCLRALGNLPGPFIKWMEKAIGADGICSLVDKLENRDVTIAVCFAYYDGKSISYFRGSMNGKVSKEPMGDNGFGFDPIFMPAGHNKTFAQMTDEELEKYSLRTTTVYPQIKNFLGELDKIS